MTKMVDTLAEEFHSILCTLSHTDQCDWHYAEDGSNVGARGKYREMAQKIISLCGNTIDPKIALRMAAILKGREDVLPPIKEGYMNPAEDENNILCEVEEALTTWREARNECEVLGLWSGIPEDILQKAETRCAARGKQALKKVRLLTGAQS